MKRKIKIVKKKEVYYFNMIAILSILFFCLLVAINRNILQMHIIKLPAGDCVLRVVYIDKFNDPGLYMALGDYYFGRGKYDIEKAKKYYEKTLSLDASYPLANYQLSRVYFINGNQSQALEYINKEIEHYPEFEKSYYIRGLIYGYTSKLDIAVKDFKKFLSSDPTSWAGHNDLAWVYFQKGEFGSSLLSAQEGLVYAPGNPWLLNTVGISLKNLGNARDAKQSFLDAKKNMAKETPESWGRAYPGNDPIFYEKGLENMKRTINKNIELLDN